MIYIIISIISFYIGFLLSGILSSGKKADEIIDKWSNDLKDKNIYHDGKNYRKGK